MRPTIQKTAPAFFLLLSLSPLLTILVFSVKKEIIQLEMRKKLKSHELQTVVIAQEKVIWMEDHEIWVNESMFDIRTKKLENGIYTFTGMYDEDETALVLKQNRATHTQKDENKLLAQLFQCLRNLYNEPEQLTQSFNAIEITYGPLAFFKFPDYIPVIPTPPPQKSFVHT